MGPRQNLGKSDFEKLGRGRETSKRKKARMVDKVGRMPKEWCRNNRKVSPWRKWLVVCYSTEKPQVTSVLLASWRSLATFISK